MGRAKDFFATQLQTSRKTAQKLRLLGFWQPLPDLPRFIRGRDGQEHFVAELDYGHWSYSITSRRPGAVLLLLSRITGTASEILAAVEKEWPMPP